MARKRHFLGKDFQVATGREWLSYTDADFACSFYYDDYVWAPVIPDSESPRVPDEVEAKNILLRIASTKIPIRWAPLGVNNWTQKVLEIESEGSSSTLDPGDGLTFPDDNLTVRLGNQIVLRPADFGSTPIRRSLIESATFYIMPDLSLVTTKPKWFPVPYFRTTDSEKVSDQILKVRMIFPGSHHVQFQATGEEHLYLSDPLLFPAFSERLTAEGVQGEDVYPQPR